NNAVVPTSIMEVSTFGWIIAFKNMRLVNLTSQQWFMVSGQNNNNIMLTSFYFDSVQFFANIQLLYTGLVIFTNCYSNGSQLYLSTMSRDVVIMASRFEDTTLTSVSEHGWTFVGSVFVGLAQVNITGSNGSIVGCVFDGTSLSGQNTQNVKIVASQFQNVSFFVDVKVSFTQGSGYSIVANNFVGYSLVLSLGQSSWAVVGFNTFTYSANLVVLAQDGTLVENVSIIGNNFHTVPSHNSFIFVSGWSPQGEPQLTGTINVLYIAFNNFTNSAKRHPYIVLGYQVSSRLRVHGLAYINIAISVVTVFISFNYFANNNGLKSNGTGMVIGYMSLQQLNSNVQLITNLIITFNVNENNNAYLPPGQTYTAQFNVGIT
ncbi:MAG: hypothetical protein RXQ22_07750, partial [Sulfolobus sp.]